VEGQVALPSGLANRELAASLSGLDAGRHSRLLGRGFGSGAHWIEPGTGVGGVD
jgi:hypothetical protein